MNGPSMRLQGCRVSEQLPSHPHRLARVSEQLLSYPHRLARVSSSCHRISRLPDWLAHVSE